MSLAFTHMIENYYLLLNIAIVPIDLNAENGKAHADLVVNCMNLNKYPILDFNVQKQVF